MCCYILPCTMQTFEIDTNCAKITIKCYHVEVSDLLNQQTDVVTEWAQNILRWSAYELTDTCATPCWKSSLSFSRTALSYTQPATSLSGFWSRYHHSSYQQNKQSRHQSSGLHYLWTRPIACVPVLCIQNVNELKQHLLDIWYSIEWSIIDSTINE